MQGLECTYRNGGSINSEGDPVWKEGTGYTSFRSPNINLPVLGTGNGQYDCFKFEYGGGDVGVGVCGGDYGCRACVTLHDGSVYLTPTISHDGKGYYDDFHNEEIFTARPGQTVHFRVSRVKVGQFKLEMMVEGGPWGHLTPEGETLRPKTDIASPWGGQGEAMEGMRIYVGLGKDASVSNLLVGRRVDVEGD